MTPYEVRNFTQHIIPDQLEMVDIEQHYGQRPCVVFVTAYS